MAFAKRTTAQVGRSGWLVALFLAVMAVPVASAVEIRHWQQPDGARVYFVESHANPILDIHVAFDAGSRRDPADKPGLASMTATLLDAGTRSLSEERLRERLADAAASLSTDAGLESAGIRLRTLSRVPERNAALDVLRAVISQPVFPPAVFEREKRRAIEGQRQQETDASYLADRALERQIYGQHPYGREAAVDVTTLTRLQRADVLAFWRSHYRPQSAVISIVGDLNEGEARQLAATLLTGLPKGGAPLPPVPAVPLSSANPAPVYLPHPGSQAHVAAGLPLFTRNDPDYFPLMVGNYILGGGGFDARLMKELRDKRGLTYGASSELVPYQEAGPFSIGFSTRKDQARSALGVMQETLRTFIEQGPTQAELDQARANIVGGFPLRFDSNAKLLGYLAVIGWYRLPLDFLDRYPREVEKVTVESVREAWRRRVDPSRMATVVVGATP